MRVYWANALFTEADRDFNAKCAQRLRASGIDVFLPQEASVNREITPTAQAIFRTDSAAILESDALVVCLDQECIDSGVACEIGFAYAYNIPMIGLYTDLRQHRSGPGKMYKNLYVVGAIEIFGQIVETVDELLGLLQQDLPRAAVCDRPSVGTLRASDYDSFVEELESWYRPNWSSLEIVDDWIQTKNPRRVLEIGCGTGTLSSLICNRYPSITYVGYDVSHEMVQIARQKCTARDCSFTSDLSNIAAEPFDLVLALFNLHDHKSKEGSLGAIRDRIAVRGSIGIIDLSTQDLPRTTYALRRGLACPAITSDPRIEPAWLAYTARDLGLTVAQCEVILRGITFPSADALERYLSVFAVYSGSDLPLQLSSGEESLTRERVANLITNWEFPFTDERVFLACLLVSQ